jgi:hypothetical protein
MLRSQDVVFRRGPVQPREGPTLHLMQPGRSHCRTGPRSRKLPLWTVAVLLLCSGVLASRIIGLLKLQDSDSFRPSRP